MRFFLCILLACSSLQAMSRSPKRVHPKSENIGVRTLKYTDTMRNLPVVVELWYPTQQTGPFDKPSHSVWLHPKEIRDVPLSKKKHPLIVMSHGHGGDRRDRSWLVEYLVQHGFIVASVEHHGNSWRSYDPLLSLRFWERASDISFTITQLIMQPELKNKIDSKRIGFVGYSLGGMTGLALGGARAENVKEIVMQLQSHRKEIDLDHVEQIDFSEAHGSFEDQRIKAMVLLSPATFIYPPKSLKNIHVPVALVASEGDEVLPFKEHAYKIITHLAPARLMLLQDKASHYVFLNRVSDAGKQLFGEEMHTELVETDRISIHKDVGAFVSKFFDEHL